MRRVLLALTVLVLAAGAALLATFRAAPLPAPAPLAETSLPPASPPAGMTVQQLPTGITHRSAAFAYRGGSFRDARDFAMTGTLVRHPKGDVLIDTGFGRDIDEQVRLMPWFFTLSTRYTRLQPAADQLRAAGYDPAHLRAVLLTHAHWDHASGLADLPGVPVWVTPEERRFVADGGWITAIARSTNARFEEYAFEGGPYLGFPRSHDVHGDGSIVVVPMPGHTPGSVVVFLAPSDGSRWALVGDLVWQREGITQREERPWVQRSLADSDPAEVREGIRHMAAIAARFPQIRIVPAHDARAFADMPALGRGAYAGAGTEGSPASAIASSPSS